ncbi:hypothetical protein ACJX0J_009889, partial [Zea mays]
MFVFVPINFYILFTLQQFFSISYFPSRKRFLFILSVAKKINNFLKILFIITLLHAKENITGSKNKAKQKMWLTFGTTDPGLEDGGDLD